ncbi:MAG: DDE-type integrase/transposase/recombinase [Candidatus Methanomethylicaceae archaeon]
MMSMTEMMETRALRAYSIVDSSSITPLDKDSFLVPSQSKNGNKYRVERINDNAWSCECADHQFRRMICKHILSVQLWLNLTKNLKPKAIKPEYSEVHECKFCGSTELMKYGKKTKQFKQRYYCKSCQRTFVPDSITRKMWFRPEVVTSVLDLYYKGVSLRNIQDHLSQICGVQLNSHATILNWIKKYESLIGDYVKTLKPEIGKQWHVDEMKVKFGGSWKWLWNVMDKDTRFLLASNITESRDVDDAREVFALAKEIAKGQKPERIISDGLPAYKKAVIKEFFTIRKPRTEHVSHIHLTGDINNNLIERLHGTKRDREKVFRGLKKEETPIIPMQDIYYNFVKPHQALQGKTPAEKSGIGIEDRNKWQGLIEKSTALKS